MKYWIVKTCMLMALILSSCQEGFEEESTVIVTSGIFDPIKVTINNQNISSNYNYGDYEKGVEAIPLIYKIVNNSKHPIKDIKIEFKDLDITEFNFTVNDENEFAFPGRNGTCERTLAAGDSCTIEIQFYSDKTQKYNQTITLSYDNVVFPNSISTKFFINSGSPAVLVYSDGKTIFKFGDLVGPSKIAVVERALAERQVKNLEIINTGELTAKEISFEEEPSCTSLSTNECPAGHENAYSYTTNCPKTLAPGASCNLDVAFQPLNKDPDVGEIADNLKEIEYRTFMKANYLNGPRNNQVALQGSFSSLSTRIQANFNASSENLIFADKITVGNRLNQSFRVSNVGYRSGHINQINVYENSTGDQIGVCRQDENDSILECLTPDLSGPMDRLDESFFLKDTNGCVSSSGAKVFLDVAQACLFQVIFQPSTTNLEDDTEHDIKLEIVYDSLFQGNETILTKDLINLQAESKSKARLDLTEVELGGRIYKYPTDLAFVNDRWDLDLGRIALESPTYFKRRKTLIRIQNTGSTKANNIVIRDGNGDVIPSIVEPPFKVNLGVNKDDNKTHFKDVSKSDNCTNLPPQAICTITIYFAPIGFSNDDSVVDANFYDSTFLGEPRKTFSLEYDTQAKYSDINLETDVEDVARSNCVISFDATLIRKALLARFMDVNENENQVEWKGSDYLDYKGKPFISGNEFEYTFVYRNIGTGPASYLYSSLSNLHATPKLNASQYELIPTTDLAAHNAQHDCLDIFDFNYSSTDTATEIQARSANWNPLPKEHACALTYKMKADVMDFVTLAENAPFESAVFTGLNWLSRGFDELGDDRDIFHQRDTDVFIPAGLSYADGDNTDPSIDASNTIHSTYGKTFGVLSGGTISEDESAYFMGNIRFRRELRAQVRPIFTRPSASAVMWRRGQTYGNPDDHPNWKDTNNTFGFLIESSTNETSTLPNDLEIEDKYWVGSWVHDYFDQDGQPSLNHAQHPSPSDYVNQQRLATALGFLNAGRSWRSPSYVDDVIEAHKDNYPIIIHVGSFPINQNNYFMFGLGNTAISQTTTNVYNFRLENTGSPDGVFSDCFPDEEVVKPEGISANDEGSIIDNVVPYYYYVGTFHPTAPGVFTNEIIVKYKDGITDNLKQDGDLRELSYPILIVGEGVADPPNLVIDVQDYTVTPQEGDVPLKALDGPVQSLNLQESDIFKPQEENELKFEYVKNSSIDVNSPYQKKTLTLRNTSTTSSITELFFLKKDSLFMHYESRRSLTNSGVVMDYDDCAPYFSGLPMSPAGLPGDRCSIHLIYKPDLSDLEFTQYLQFGYQIAPNQFSHRGFVASFKPVDPANLKTDLDKNSFRNVSGNLVPNASTLEVGTVTMNSSVVTRTFNDIRLYNTSETPASLLNEYHQYLMDNNLKGYSAGSPPGTDFIPPAEDYALKGSYNMVLFKKITYDDGSNRFLVYGSETCFIGDDEYPAAEDHYLEGFHSDSNDCYLSIEANFNKEYIARKVNFSDGNTTEGNYFALSYYNNERLNISNNPLYFVFNGTFNPDNTTSDGDIYNVEANFHSKSIQFDFNPMNEVNNPMGEIVGYRVFYSTSKNSVANVLYTNIVPDYVDIRDDLENPKMTLANLDAATFYYFKIYPIRSYADRNDPFLNPSFKNLAIGEYLSKSDLATHKIVVPSETTSFHYENQMLIKKSYVSTARVTFSDAIINCGMSSDTFKKDGVSSLLSFSLITDDVWSIIQDNPLYSSYSSGSIQSLPHWIDTPPINVDTAFSGVDGYDSEEVSQVFSNDQLFYLRNESNFNGSVQKLEGGGPSPVSTNYTNYVTPGIPFGVARCYYDTSN
jgi:hypothetical protein